MEKGTLILTCKKKEVKRKPKIFQNSYRRERDSNPRYKKLVQRISNQSLSTTQPSLQPWRSFEAVGFYYVYCSPNPEGKQWGFFWRVIPWEDVNLLGTRLNFPTRLPISWSIPQPFHNQVRDGVGVVPIEHRAPKNQRSVAPEIERSKSLDL